jgi:hypothetical protein
MGEYEKDLMDWRLLLAKLLYAMEQDGVIIECEDSARLYRDGLVMYVDIDTEAAS